MSDASKKKHNGRRHDKEFRIAAVKLVTEQGYTPKQAALSLGVHGGRGRKQHQQAAQKLDKGSEHRLVESLPKANAIAMGFHSLSRLASADIAQNVRFCGPGAVQTDPALLTY